MDLEKDKVTATAYIERKLCRAFYQRCPAKRISIMAKGMVNEAPPRDGAFVIRPHVRRQKRPLCEYYVFHFPPENQPYPNIDLSKEFIQNGEGAHSHIRT